MAKFNNRTELLCHNGEVRVNLTAAALTCFYFFCNCPKCCCIYTRSTQLLHRWHCRSFVLLLLHQKWHIIQEHKYNRRFTRRWRLTDRSWPRKLKCASPDIDSCTIQDQPYTKSPFINDDDKCSNKKDTECHRITTSHETRLAPIEVSFLFCPLASSVFQHGRMEGGWARVHVCLWVLVAVAIEVVIFCLITREICDRTLWEVHRQSSSTGTAAAAAAAATVVDNSTDSTIVIITVTGYRFIAIANGLRAVIREWISASG